MKVVILAGGFGTRISEESHLKPKPMIEIGEKPILWHIMKEYSAYGINEFIICAGYKQHVIKEWFADYFIHTSDITFDFTKGNEMIIHNKHAEPWKVTVVDTGLNTQTGGRIKRVKDFVGDDTFMVTYGDAVGDINIDELLVKQNVEVIAVVRRGTKNLNTINALPVKIVECNIADYHMLPDMIADRDIDVVFHIAWQGVSDLDARNEAIQMQNLQSTLDLIDAMHIMRIGCFIGCGSMHEAESLVEMNEDKVISNLGYMYKATKTAAHWIGKAKCGTYGIRFFWPLINTYGEEERSARLVNTIIRKVLHGESPDLSAGNQYYDFVHVSDVARALILIAEKGVDGTNYTIGSGDAKPLKEFLKIVGQVANDLHDGEPVELGFGKITSNVISLPITTFDVTKLYKDTGFKPLIPFRKGIERTARWIKEDEGM